MKQLKQNIMYWRILCHFTLTFVFTHEFWFESQQYLVTSLRSDYTNGPNHKRNPYQNEYSSIEDDLLCIFINWYFDRMIHSIIVLLCCYKMRREVYHCNLLIYVKRNIGISHGIHSRAIKHINIMNTRICPWLSRYRVNVYQYRLLICIN